ncbi:MAG: hypothetical protein JO130_09085, partial [Solirubrobacterales bacterium]|nr:hypothetical protein [Solirubrobacterales bacterium]
IQDSFGDTTTLTWTGGYITQITDPTGRVYTYAQNASGQLASYTDPDHNTSSYSYDSYGNLTQITTGDGNITNVAYDTGASERATSITRLVNPSDSTGPTTSYAYAGASGPCTGDSGWKETIVTDPDSHHTTYCADDLGRIASVTDANGNVRSSSYTPDGYIKTLTSALNTPETFTYASGSSDNVTQIQDGTGSGAMTERLQYNDTTNQYQPTQSTDAQSNNTNYAYDANGNLKTITDGLSSQNQASLTYNSDGTVASSKDADGNTTTYGYTGHLLTTITPPSGSGLNPISLQYDGDKRVIEISSVSGGTGHEVDYTYDSEDRVNTATYKDASGTIVAAIGYDYDPDGNLQERDDNAGATNFAYDGLNRLTDAKYPDSSTDHYDYDAASNLTALTDAGGKVTYGYDPANQLTSVLDPGASTATALAYDSDGNLKSVTYPGGSSISRTYNALDQLTNVSDTYQTGGSPYSITRAITYNGNLQSTVTDQTGNKTTYTYDALNRLTDAKVMNGTTQVRDNAYTLDGNGNITKSTLNGTSTSYAYNPGNEICWSVAGASTNGCGSPPSGAYSYSYDADGQQTSNGNATTMAYNALGQMTSETISGTTTSFAYLGAGQDELIGDGTSTLHNDILGLASTTPSGSSSTYYTRNINGQHIDERTPSGTYYYLYDGNDNVIGLTDSSGHLARAYNYDPYGNTTYSTGTTANPFGFQDGYQTSTGLYHYGARYENPLDARWTQQDPLSHVSDLSQNDRYGFAGEDPVNLADPTGKGLFSDIVAGVGEVVTGAGCVLVETGAGALVCVAGQAVAAAGVYGAASGK